MTTLTVCWSLFEDGNSKIEVKHCKMCGKNTTFTDSGIRRHNSNGKSIYRYAIYKCLANHTWNKKLSTYKAHSNHVKLLAKEKSPRESSILQINLEECSNIGIKRIVIKIREVQGHFRIDQLLSNNIIGISRNEVCKKLKSEQIKVNYKKIKPSSVVKTGDEILFCL